MPQFRYGERERGLARAEYKAFEPYHLVAYFGPHVTSTYERLGLRWRAGYTGLRGSALGAVPSALVASTFFNFNPSAIARAWDSALENHSVDDLNAARTDAVDAGLRDALGDRVDDPALVDAAQRMQEVISTASVAGRPLASAYAALPRPREPHLQLWQDTTLWREWRGDGHIAALTLAGLDPVESLVLYDADLRSKPSTVLHGRDRSAMQPSRQWDDEAWNAAVERLTTRDLVARDPEGNAVLTDEGATLRQRIEDQTDDAAGSVWVDVTDADAEALFAAVRPFVKAVIDAGFLPGTSRKDRS